MRVVHVKDVRGVEDDVQQEQGTEKPEEGVGDDGGPESRVASHATYFVKKFGRDVPIETAGGIGGRNFADAEAGEEADDGEREEDDAGPHLAAVESLGEKAPSECGADRGEEGAEFDDAVAPAQFGEGQQLGEQAVLGGAEDCALRAGEEQGDAGDVQTIACQRESGQAHDAELENFGPERDASFAVLVGEIPARDGEEQKGNSEEQRHYQNKPEIAALLGERGVEHKEADEPFEGVVAEGALKLHRDERPEAAKAERLGLGLGVGFGRAWR